MKYWKEGKSENGYGPKGLILKGEDERVLSIVRSGDTFTFREECDGVFSENFSKNQALEMVEELRQFILEEAIVNILNEEEVVKKGIKEKDLQILKDYYTSNPVEIGITKLSKILTAKSVDEVRDIVEYK